MAWRDGQDGQSDLGDRDVRVGASAGPMGYMEARQRLGPSTLEVASRVTRRPVARRVACPRLGGGARWCDRQGAGGRQTQDLESESVASLGTGLGWRMRTKSR